MNCSECGWCKLEHAESENVVCSNEKSEKYNQIFKRVDRDNIGCDAGEYRQALDYVRMTPWEFASKYYM